MAGRHKKHPPHEEHPDERWLVTFADMLVLLLALFIVLYALSERDPSKAEPFAQAMREASGKILPGGTAIARTGGQVDTSKLSQQPPSPSIQQALGPRRASKAEADREQEELERIRQRIEAAAAADGLTRKVRTSLDASGLNVRLLSDDFLFASGRASLDPRADRLMRRIAELMRLNGTHAIRVAGHTDNVPVTGRYPSNWELSTARASAVIRALSRYRVAPARMEAAGKAHLDPVASNATDRGRAENRRVEILIPRQKIATEGEAS